MELTQGQKIEVGTLSWMISLGYFEIESRLNLDGAIKSKLCLLQEDHVPARKKFCRNGHEYSKENTYIDPKGVRRCSTCKRNWEIKSREKLLLKRGL